MFEDLLKKLTHHYRTKKRELLRLETKQIQTPSQELNDEIKELSGYLKGLLKGIEGIEKTRAGSQFKEFEEGLL